MMILLAYDPDNRYAFTQTDAGAFVHLRPPFDVDYPASEHGAEYAVGRANFIACRKEFATRDDLLKFLSDESVRGWSYR